MIVAKQTAVMFTFIFAGYLLFKQKIITDTGSRELGRLLLYMIMPSVIINSLIQSDKSQLSAIGISFALSALMLMISIAVCGLAFGKKNPIENFGASFSNAGFIGIPLVQAALGEEAVLYVTGFVVLVNLLQWTYGVMVMTDSKDMIRMKNLIRNPIVISMCIGFALLTSGISLPEIMKKPIQMCSGMNGPVAMISLGVYLAQSNVKACLRDWSTYTSAVVRLLVIPALSLLVISLLPFQNLDMKLAILIAASAPIGSNVAIFAQLYGADYKKAVQQVCVSTILSMITMPVILWLAVMLL